MKTCFAFLFLLLFTFTHAQNVGIGTTLPNGRLTIGHISTLSSPTLLLFDSNAMNFSRLQFQNASGNKFWHVAGYLDNVNDANSRLNFYHSVAGDIVSLTGDGKVGIGTTNPSAKLTVNGTVKITDGTQGAGKVLTSDAGGNATWTAQSPPSTNTAFSVMPSGATAVAYSYVATIPFDNTINTYGIDDAHTFNNSSHGYVAPSTGVYVFTLSISLNNGTAASDGYVAGSISKNGFSYNTPNVIMQTFAGKPLPKGGNCTMMLKLNAGDIIRATVYNNCNGTTITVAAVPDTNFTGYRIY